MTLRHLVALAAIPVAAVLACSDPYAPKAFDPVRLDTLNAYALNGTAPEAASAVRIFYPTTAVPDFTEQFDFALDIDATGNVVVIPRAKVVSCTIACQLGIQLSNTSFDSLYDAPSNGFRYDSITTLPVGKTAVFVTKESLCTQSNISTYDMYAKMVVDSVHPADRQIFFRIATDRNCGFRGLVPGTIPKH